MSSVGLVHLVERLFNQTQSNATEGNAGTARGARQQAASGTEHDEFQHSGSNTANEAGLFQVQQKSVFSAAAAIFLVENDEQQNDGTPTAASQTTGGNPATDTTAATTQAATVPTANTNASANSATDAATTSNAELLAGLQTLNSALAALGLSQNDIAVVDRVAQLINDFSPAAFTSLVNQLQVLQQDSAQTPANSPAATAANTTAANTAATAPQNGGGFSIQELSIKFAGVNETLQQAGNGNNANGQTIEVSAFQLQVSEVNLTLANNTTGQTAQIQAPQPAVPATATPALTKAATA